MKILRLYSYVNNSSCNSTVSFIYDKMIKALHGHKNRKNTKLIPETVDREISNKTNKPKVKCHFKKNEFLKEDTAYACPIDRESLFHSWREPHSQSLTSQVLLWALRASAAQQNEDYEQGYKG